MLSLSCMCTIRERLQHYLARVDLDQWASLLAFWGSREGVRARNPDEQALDWIDVFRMTHTCRDGWLVDQALEDELRWLNERASQQSESSQIITTRDGIFTQVMGEDLRVWVRTFWLGVTPYDI